MQAWFDQMNGVELTFVGELKRRSTADACKTAAAGDDGDLARQTARARTRVEVVADAVEALQRDLVRLLLLLVLGLRHSECSRMCGPGKG